MKFKEGDSVQFGREYCEYTGKEYLLGQTVMLRYQYFEYDNGLYTEDQSCLGIYNEEDEEADSIYHLFGNKLDGFMDCKLIEASESDLEFVRLDNERIMREREKEAQDMIDYFEKMYENENLGM